MLRDNRTFQFAVGLTAIFIVIRWLLTGDLLMAFESLKPPAEGETKSVSFISVVGPMLIEAVVIVGSSVIAWSIKLWDLAVALIDKIHQARADPAASLPVAGSVVERSVNTIASGAATLVSSASAAVPVQNASQLVTDLARAVASGDEATEAQLKMAIRRPYLRVELSEAVASADYEKARSILGQLEQMDAFRVAGSGAVRT